MLEFVGYFFGRLFMFVYLFICYLIKNVEYVLCFSFVFVDTIEIEFFMEILVWWE